MLINVPKNRALDLGTSQPKRKRLAWAIMFLGYSALLVAIGAELYKEDFFSSSVMPYLRFGWRWPVNKINSFSSTPKTLAIDMNWEAHQYLSFQKDLALKNQSLLTEGNNLVNAKITVDDVATEVKMRLKGDNVDHLRGDKWSFRVSGRNDMTVLGMKQFSLHHPRARNWMFEWFGQQLMRREGVTALRYDFVDVTLNGKDLGIYALEEHFEKRLIEHNERREGPILRYDEEPMWREINQITRPFRGAENSGSGDYLAAEPDGFGTKAIASDPAVQAMYVTAVHLLEQFRRGEVTTSKAFDYKKLATYFALVDLLGGEHGSRWHNIRFYYNPVTSLLEPIAFDLNAGQPIRSLSIFAWNPSTTATPFPARYEAFQKRLFEDKDFRVEYLGALNRVSQKEFLDNALKDVDAEAQAALNVLHTEFPFYEFSPDILYKNQTYIQTLLQASDGVHAMFVEKIDNRLRFQIGNTQYLPLTLVGLEVPGHGVLPLTKSVEVEPRRLDEPVKYLEVDFDSKDIAEPFDPATWFVQYKVASGGSPSKAAVTPHFWKWDKLTKDDFLRQEPNVTQFDFLTVDENKRSIAIKPGHWTIREPMIFPAGYTIHATAGTDLDLVESAIILSRSPLLFEGNEDESIVIQSSDGTGQGLVVLQAEAQSVLEYVNFRKLTNPNRNGWVLTGAVTFFESPVSIDHCSFSNNNCEDGLNLIRTPFSLTNSAFSDTKSDAFDADFCKGEIANCSFVRCTNDGVDVSGSVVSIRNLSVTESRDKAVSAGEASRVTLDGLKATKTRIGMASKDRSELMAKNVTLNECAYGLAAYQKKPEFGPGVMKVIGLTNVKVNEMFLVEQGSTVYVDDHATYGSRHDVKEIVYGPESGIPPK